MMIVAYLYWPVIYLIVYRPFILPRLSSWDHVPLTLLGAIAIGYLAVLVAAGRRRTHRAIALNALGIALAVEALSLLVAWVQTPAVGRIFASGFDPWEALAMAVHAVVVLACLEVGRALTRAAKPRGVPASTPSAQRRDAA